MKPSALHPGERIVLEPQGLDALIDLLARSGYRVIGPRVRDGCVVYDEVASTQDLPSGWTDEQTPDSYRLKKRRDQAYFGYSVGSHSWKQFLHPPHLTIFRARRNGSGLQILPPAAETPKYAFLGVRPCDLAAISYQDRVLLEGKHPDATYAARRKNCFIVAVNCSDSGGNCFCASMGVGPRAAAPFDLALTEVVGKTRHFFVCEIGSGAGAEAASHLPSEPATDEHVGAEEAVLSRAAAQMGKALTTEGLKESLQASYESAHWEAVAERCLTCGNCTSVCPTCFCTTVEDYTDLTGESAERRRRWDSCFTLDFSYIFGGSVRTSAAARYRQWLMHKLANWEDQFGTPGCVGCGRCITWCPVGIDIAKEAETIRAGASPGKEQARGNP
ncbi:MAG TPA: 4Fe-4S dicluster domain-containing protein [Armatimonadota bacterium]|jgi:formate hydrogenlyase subunit 6/NADH:ubiquinone oxidoreductase subunit I